MGSLRDEAAAWFALMRGPDAAASRLEFEAWLAEDALHRDAYNRIGETFSLGKALKRAPAGESGVLPAAALKPASLGTRSSAWGAFALATVLVLAIFATVTGALKLVGPGNPIVSRAMPPGRQDLATSRGQIRTFTLDDGSRVTLDTESRIEVALTPLRRDVELVKGRARFVVAHEQRPFVVAAAGGAIVARGTIFDVALDQTRGVVVNLIEGVVDVRAASGQIQADRDSVTRMTAGTALAFGGAAQSHRVEPLANKDWPAELRDFNAVPLGSLVVEANRYGGKPLVLASGDLAELQVSGTFAIRDTHRLARNLGDLLDLAVHEDRGKLVLAKRCEAGTGEKCMPPS